MAEYPSKVQCTINSEANAERPDILYTVPHEGLGEKIASIGLKKTPCQKYLGEDMWDCFIHFTPQNSTNEKEAKELIKNLRYEGILSNASIIMPNDKNQSATVRLSKVDPHTALSTIASALANLYVIKREYTENIVRQEMNRTGLKAEAMGLISFVSTPNPTYRINYPSAVSYVKDMTGRGSAGKLIRVGFLGGIEHRGEFSVKDALEKQFPSNTVNTYHATGSHTACPASLQDTLHAIQGSGELPDFIVEAIINHAHHVVAHHEHHHRKAVAATEAGKRQHDTTPPTR